MLPKETSVLPLTAASTLPDYSGALVPIVTTVNHTTIGGTLKSPALDETPLTKKSPPTSNKPYPIIISNTSINIKKTLLEINTGSTS